MMMYSGVLQTVPPRGEHLEPILIPILESIHKETELDEFLIGGSYATAQLAGVLNTICLNDDTFDSLALKANDIDTYHGNSTDDPGMLLIVDLGGIKYHKVEGLELEINTVKCSNLSPDTFMVNNDLNVTGACFNVNFAGDEGSKLFTIHVSPQLWTFFFKNHDERQIKAIDRGNVDLHDATTCVRIAYKAWQMPSFGFDLGSIDYTKGTLANSQKEKFDKIKNWGDNPFKEYRCNKHGNHFVMTKRHERVYCCECRTGRANATCSHKRCRGCCSKHVRSGASKCKVKPHIKAAEAENQDEGNEVVADQ
jgi:hypothetical protein